VRSTDAGGALLGIGLYVAPADADRRRAKEALALRGLVVGDPA
jgi:hypothetical protein